MDIIHLVNVHSSSKEFFSAVIEMGIPHRISEYPSGKEKLLSFNISENDPHWDTVYQLLKTYQGFDIYHGDIFETVFSEDEIRTAEWLRMISIFEQGYPQPLGKWPIKQLSLSNVCPECGIYEQTNPLRLKKEPSLGKKSFMSLYGVAEIFATPVVFSSFEAIGAKGYEAWEAILHRSNQPSERVCQLYVPGTAQPGLFSKERLGQVVCQTCGTTKYIYHRKGVMYIKREALLSGVDFIKTNEWFGSGLIAFREILISNRVAKLILDKGWLGVQLKVVELV